MLGMPLDTTGCEREEPPVPANGGTQSGSSEAPEAPEAPDPKEKRCLFGRSSHFGRPCMIFCTDY